MQSKTIYVALLASLSIILTAVFVTMFITLAASTQGVSSLIRVTYVAPLVNANVSANKYFKTDNPIPFTGGTNGVVNFAENTSANQTLTTQTTTLTFYDQYVVYEYVFENLDSDAMYISLETSNISSNNLRMFYTAPTTTRKTNIYTSYPTDLDYTEGTSIAATSVASLTTAYVYVVIKIKKLTEDVTYNLSSNFVWTIQNGSTIT